MTLSLDWHTLWSNSQSRGYNNLEYTSDGTLAFGGRTQHEERRDALEHSPAYPHSEE